MNVWRLITHHEQAEKVLQWSRENRRIAIGWGLIGDMNRFNSPKELAESLRRTYPRSNGAPSLWRFYHDIEIGDLVILSTGKDGRRRLVMKVRGPYEYVQQEEARPLYKEYRDDPSYHHQRVVSITSYDPDALWDKAGAKPANGDNIRWTLIKCAKSVDQL